jgi:hypothetical protein
MRTLRRHLLTTPDQYSPVLDAHNFRLPNSLLKVFLVIKVAPAMPPYPSKSNSQKFRSFELKTTVFQKFSGGTPAKAKKDSIGLKIR